MAVSEQMVQDIVKEVMAKLQLKEETTTQKGVFADMNEAIAAAKKAQKVIHRMSMDQREKIITNIRRKTMENAETFARMGVEETGMGNVGHKILKHRLVAEKTPGTEDIKTTAWSGDRGLTLVEMGPFGVIGAITPCTNPSETVICNSIGMIAAGNGVVFNPHPGAIATSNYAVDLINRASLMAGGPEVLVASVVKPTLDTANIMYKHPAIKLLVCTGGPGVVRSVLSSGKKAIGAGAGNPPVIVDDTADVRKAGKDIIDGCTFDNNLPCIAEKEVFVFNNVADRLIAGMQKNGSILLTRAQADELAKIVLVDKTNPKTGKTAKIVNRDCVGRDCRVILEKIGIKVGPEIRCAIAEVPFEHLFVQEELMMPILPLVRVKDVDTAIDMAIRVEHGFRHTAIMHSRNVDKLTKMAKLIQTTIFVKNGPSYAGIGVGGMGYTTFTIAGPTGEGLTSAKAFARKRRCVLVGGFDIR